MIRVLYRTAVVALLLVCCCARGGLADDQAAAKANAADQPAKEKVSEQKDEDQKAGDKKSETKPEAPAPVKRPAPRALAPTVGNADVLKARNDAMAAQWLQQLRPTLVAELLFIRQTCDLSKEQRPKIKAAGEASLQDAATKFAQPQKGGRVRVAADGSAQSIQSDPRTIIREGLAQALKETLTPEQMAQYTEEAAARLAQRKRAAILSVVSRLDGILYLTADQRDEITNTLSSNWQDKWETWLMMLQYGAQYFPQVPDEHLVAYLSPQQKAVWAGLQKIEFNFFGGQIAQPQDDAEWWGEEPAKGAAPAALKALLDGWFSGTR